MQLRRGHFVQQSVDAPSTSGFATIFASAVATAIIVVSATLV